MSRMTPRNTIVEIIGEHEDGIEIEEIIAESGYGKSTVWRVMRDLSNEGIAGIVGHCKPGPNGNAALYGIIAAEKPVFDESPMRQIIGRLRSGMIDACGPFAVMAAQVTA